MPLAVGGGWGLFASKGLDLKYNCNCRNIITLLISDIVETKISTQLLDSWFAQIIMRDN